MNGTAVSGTTVAMGLAAVTIALAAVIFVLQGISKHLGEISEALQREQPRTWQWSKREPMFKHEGVLPEAMGTPGDD